MLPAEIQMERVLRHFIMSSSVKSGFFVSFTVCQNDADRIRLRERQHGDIHFHGGAVGGVDMKSAL